MSDNAIVTIEGAAVALRTFGMSEHADLITGLGKAAARIAELEAQLVAARANVIGMNAARETEAYRAAVLAERDACASIPKDQIGEPADWYDQTFGDGVDAYRDAIRARPAP